MRFIFPLIISILIASCAKKEKQGMISGRFKNAEKSWVYLQKITERGDSTIDSTFTGADGSFSIKNPSKTPEFYLLRANEKNVIFLVLDKNENAEVSGDANNLEVTYDVKGSHDSEILHQLRIHDRMVTDSINKLYEYARDNNPMQKDSVGLELQNVYTTEMEAFSKKFIKNNLGSIVSLSATKFINQQAELELLNQLSDSLGKKYDDNPFVKDYEALIAELNKLPPGSICPDITLNTPDGKPLSLTSLRGKVVLVDFWASWCAPCRRENPELVKLYKRFKGNDFEIFGVSLDENVAAWKNAVEKDGITWPQVSDLKRWDSEVVKEFKIEAIPYSILIDREGRIVAKGLRSEELELKIMQTIGRSS